MIIAILCILYYVVLCIYLKRIDFGFSKIWVFLAAIILVLKAGFVHLPKMLQLVGTVIGLVGAVIFLSVEILVVKRALTPDPKRLCRYLIVLGAKVDGYHPTTPLKQRLNRAIEYLEKHRNCKVVVSGGQGRGELVSEASAMADYLLARGIASQRIIREEASTTTRENLIFSGRLILADSDSTDLRRINIGIVTNSFHVFRAEWIAGQVGYQKASGIRAKTTKIMFLNYSVREFFGIIKMLIEKNCR